MMIRKLTLSTVAGVLTFVATSSVAPPTVAAERTVARTTRVAPASIDALRLDTPLTRASATVAVDPSLLHSRGAQQVLVRFKSPSVAESGVENPADQVMRREQIRLEQNSFVSRVQRAAPGARVIAEVQGVLNAVVLQADAAAIKQIAADPAVARVSRVIDYKLDLAETVPYITARRLQNLFKGSGIKVAVLDSGIDYTHVEFGGAGTAAAYAAAYGTATTDSRNTTRDGLFPTARVVNGYDFVGESWPHRLASPRTTTRSIAARPRFPAPAGTAPTLPTSSAVLPAWPPRSTSTRSRSAARSRPRAAVSRCCRAWNSLPIRTVTATIPTACTSSTCRSARLMASRSTTTSSRPWKARRSWAYSRSPRRATRATSRM